MVSNSKKLPRGIRQRADGTYEGRFKYDNVPYSVYGKTIKETVEKKNELYYEVKHGLKGKLDSISLDKWFEAWIDDYKSNTVKESTLIRYTDYYNQYIKKQLGKRKMEHIKPIVLQRVLNKMADDGYATKTIADTYNILNGMFRLAEENGIIMKNPCGGVILPETTTRDQRVLTVEEQKEVLKYAKNRACETLVRVALGTGMRAGEILALTWDDVDFERREINVNKTLLYMRDKKTGKYVFKNQEPKTKTGKRIIPMQLDVYHALKKQRFLMKQLKFHANKWSPLKGFENLIFVNSKGKPRRVGEFRKDLQLIEEDINRDRAKKGKSPMKHFYPHALRHTFATRCFESGIGAKTVQTWLGHSSVAITLDLYTHVTDDKSKCDMDKLDQVYQKLG